MPAPAVGSVEPKSEHLSDPSIQSFLQPDFNPADYLNGVLPRSSQASKTVPLLELSTQLQSTLSQLNAQSVRLSNALTQLTDEIIRSGGRLAYEVDVLRGETLGLTEAFESGLRKDLDLFADEGNHEQSKNADGSSPPKAEPEYFERLRSLTAVRARLDSVIKVFGDAMQWPLAPSELQSVGSSLISVSAPGSSDDERGREAKAKAFMDNARHEISMILETAGDSLSVEAAEAKVAELRKLAEVWKGTAEEKARMKLVDGLQRVVDDGRKSLENASNARRPAPQLARNVDMRYGNTDSVQGGYGFLQNLRSLRNDVYLE